MSTKIYTAKQLVKPFTRMVASLLLLFCLLPATTSAATTQTYALECSPSGSIAVKKNAISCSGSGNTASVAAVGSNAASTSSNQELTVVTVNWGNCNPANISAGDKVQKGTFACDRGGLSIKKGAVIPSQGNNPCNSSGTCGDPAANPNANCSDNGCDLIQKYLNPLINLLSLTFGLVAAGSIIAGAIQYTASAGDPQKVSKAKTRIINTLVAVVAYMLLYGGLQFLVPGGLFKAG